MAMSTSMRAILSEASGVAKALAEAAPMPLEAPVMKAILFFNMAWHS